MQGDVGVVHVIDYAQCRVLVQVIVRDALVTALTALAVTSAGPPPLLASHLIMLRVLSR